MKSNGRIFWILRVSIRSCAAAVALAVSGLTGCAAIQMKPGAERVIVTRQPAPAGCKYLGGVVGNQGGSLTGGLTSNRNLAEGAMNDMKNKAFDLGANFVVLETNQAGSTESG